MMSDEFQKEFTAKERFEIVASLSDLLSLIVTPVKLESAERWPRKQAAGTLMEWATVGVSGIVCVFDLSNAIEVFSTMWWTGFLSRNLTPLLEKATVCSFLN